MPAQAQGVKVVRSTRCAQGRVLARPDDKLPDSAGLSPVKARIALMLGLLQ
jgi:L-asparaginase